MTSSETSRASNEDILKVTIHYCENLKPSILLLQPVLCMHVIDAKSGTYVKKSDRNRAVVSFYENQRDDVDYIMPVMTQPCSLSGEKLTLLNWDEIFVLNERYDVFLKQDSNVILFFEIVDLMPISRTKHRYERLNHNGMCKLAWAFLKIIGSNGSVNTGSKLRLQLYKPGKSQKKTQFVEVYDWWLKKSRTPMEASLYITFEPYATFVAKPALRSMLPIQQEKGSTTFEKLAALDKETSLEFTEESNSVSMDDQATEITWSRKPEEPCEIPQKKTLLLDIINCCHILKFSSSGRVLAAGCGAHGCYYLMFYRIPQGNLLHKMLAHSELIYDLDWSYNDNYLLSASGDYNVKMWNTKSWNSVATFVHPSFVYSVKFRPTLDNLLATACYDHIVRIWASEKCQLLNELEAHSSSVCTLCWNPSGTKLYSADGIGQIKLWTKSKLIKGDTYQLKSEMAPEETKCTTINKMVLDLKEETLCLFCSDSVARIMDLVNGSILSSYESDVSSPKFSRGCCSPCGNLLFLCCDKGSISVWNKTSCNKYPESVTYNLNYGGPSCIEYHPHDHILALSFWDDEVPIHIYVKEGAGHGSADTVINTLGTKASKCDKTFSHVSRICSVSKKSYKLPERTATNNIKLSNKTDGQLPETHIAVSRDITRKVFEGHSEKSKKFEEIALSGSSNAFIKKPQEKYKTESLTAITTKSSQLDMIAVTDESTHSDSNIFRSLSNNSFVPNRSSKRSQRRKKLREMNKALH